MKDTESLQWRSLLTSLSTEKSKVTEKIGRDFVQMFKLLFGKGHSLAGYQRDFLTLNLGATGAKRFMDISGISGIDSITDGRGAVYADFDNDGDLDVFLTNLQSQPHLLFRNNIGQKSAWIRVTLKGNKGGTDAFGAVVRMKFSGGIQTKVKAGGEGFMSQHDPRLLFGLGNDKRAEWVEVTWPSGLKQRFNNIEAGSSLLITEGDDKLQKVAEHHNSLPNPPARTAAVTRAAVK